MKTIKTMEDIRKHRSERTLPSRLLEHLEKFYVQLFEWYEDGEPIGEFDLGCYGYFVVLEQSDNVRYLVVGLNPEDGGLLGCCPEKVQLLTLSNGTQMYWLSVVCAGSYAMNFFSLPGKFDNEVEA